MENIPKEIQQHFNSLSEIFRRHSIVRAYIFGSALKEKFSNHSDIDFLIAFDENIKDPLIKGELWWNLHDTLRDLFDSEIDLVTESSLKNPYFIEELNNTKQLVYGA